MSSTTMMLPPATSPARNTLDDSARWGLWALPVFAALLVYGTLTHQPDPTTDFPGYARYVTTPEFLIHHLVASIFGAAVGMLGLTALCVILGKGRTAPLALWALVLGIIGLTFNTSGFGVAAFAQSAIGHAYLSGHTAEAVAINNDVYGPALTITLLLATLVFLIANILFGVAVARSGSLPKWAGIGLAVSGVAFPVCAILFDNFLEPIGAVLMVVFTMWIAIAGWRTQRP